MFFLVCLVEFLSETVQPWTFVWEEIFFMQLIWCAIKVKERGYRSHCLLPTNFLITHINTHAKSYAMLCYAKSLQLCPTLCDPIDGSLPGSPVPGILQGRTLEWVAISFSNAWKWKVKVKLLSRVWLLATPWTAAYQAPPSMGFSKQEYWSGVPLPSPQVKRKESQTCIVYKRTSKAKEYTKSYTKNRE